MVLNILLLAILFIAGLFNLFFFFNTKKFHACFQSFFQSSIADPKPSSQKTDDDKVRSSKPELRRVFATFDKDSDGFITKQELRDSLKNIRIFLSEREVDEMVGKLDANGDGLIDFEEFGALCESTVGRDHERVVMRNDGGDEEEDLKEAFDVFDKDKDGLISSDELGSILSSLGLKEGKRVESCKEMIKKVDMDGDGMVNFQEFKKMMKSGAFNISN